MATYTSNYAWTKPEGSDPVDIGVLNGNLDSQDNIVHNAYMQLAPVFSASATYAVDDVVLYANNLYKCITAVTVAGDWDSTKWTQVKVSDIAGGGGGGTSDYDQLQNRPQINGVTLTGNKSTQDLNIVYGDIGGTPTLGTASAKDVPVSGNASSSQVVMGDDTRLTDSRPASDVQAWAKAQNKPTYTASEVGAIASTDKGVANGVAELDANGLVPSAQLPSYVDDVLEYASLSAFPATGETGKIYVALDTNKTYRWSGSAYVEISESLALGETSSTAYRGDRGKNAYDHSQSDHGTIAPAFSEAGARVNIATGDTLSTIMGKISKFFNDLKTVAFTGSFSDLSNKPENANTFQGTIAEWNQLTTAEKKAYDHASIPDSLDGNVIFPASKVMLNSGDSVEDRLDAHTLGNSVDISGYTASTPYTCPSDGYVRMYITGAANYILVNGFTLVGGSTAGYYAVFVKKGMTVYLNAGANTAQLIFKPIE